MLEKKFNKPTFLNPYAEIPDEVFPGTSTVKALVQELPEYMSPGEEAKTDHFFIKQALTPRDTNIIDMPEYQRAWYLSDVVMAVEELERQSKTVTPEGVAEYFADDSEHLKLQREVFGETVLDNDNIKRALDLMNPETVLRHMKELYERHRQWYNSEISGFVINKLYVLGKDADGRKHGYVIKQRVDSPENEYNELELSFSKLIMAAWTDEGSEGLSFVRSQLLSKLQQHLSLEQGRVLRGEIKKFTEITRRLIHGEDIVIDMGAIQNKSPNIWINADGHLRMIDTDRIYPAKAADGELDNGAEQTLRFLDSLDYIAEHMEDRLAS